ncbi:MAG: flagellar biosynthetic protein FliQ [Piscirickettsiaceae bacterium CG_4_9_14_3_um_filter_43_564]|nr:flagellar biosynthesis protein FliQ [Thiomicrospira sp.]PIQ04956.1 MAG: flagellar biosynthetic protein FliQ [Piscirickettsiaceae bacterium CG18_big_fil_WC_8_21_14_2_50_44_103]PIU38231.1 MAG: flagellar biosynthetic protein FliQ [Piscirickettsiaceae bacterium CG07_land_8_20_14_0_80_44_28]PIW57319.1 MAG: flagellar biosynthetic protein FliQ [Piscirickettsiaceae bacterium CG12_big_fil_rev_8_21_14_0_65_44_934]PIW76926.1 MAG: flagellar biosynthetic protein FliQ [Piscirickettsiaceae bacterium CG_4_8
MTPELVLSIGQKMLEVVMMLAAPLLLPALAVGLLVGMFQAATQINEMTLSFIPKVAIVGLALVLGGNWMLTTLISFSRELIENIPNFIG